MTNLTTIRLAAPNDRNGNPRRVFITFDRSGNILATYDEGYEGYDAITNQKHRDACTMLTFKTSVSEYNRYKNWKRN